jgi:hypothetical protein
MSLGMAFWIGRVMMGVSCVRGGNCREGRSMLLVAVFSMCMHGERKG